MKLSLIFDCRRTAIYVCLPSIYYAHLDLINDSDYSPLTNSFCRKERTTERKAKRERIACHVSMFDGAFDVFAYFIGF